MSEQTEQRIAREHLEHRTAIEQSVADADALSLALGTVDAAHVDLDRQGVTRCEGEALQDRIARFGGTLETQIEDLRAELADEIRGHEDRHEQLQAAEARATAAETAHQRLQVFGRDWMDRATSAWKKLAAAEQREAEKDKALVCASAEMRHAYRGRADGPIDARLISRVIRILEEATTPLASPSPPSPAPSPECHPANGLHFTVVGSTSCLCGAVSGLMAGLRSWPPAPSPKQEPTT